MSFWGVVSVRRDEGRWRQEASAGEVEGGEESSGRRGPVFLKRKDWERRRESEGWRGVGVGD